MSRRHEKIFAIDPGTREMGVAFLEGDELIYHQVKVFRNRATPHENLQEGRTEILRLMHYFRPDILAIEKTFFSYNRNTALLNVLSDEVIALAARHGLLVKSFAPSTIKKFMCGDGRASKEAVAKAVVAKFPELRVYLDQNRKWKSSHHSNMFDAIALALLARHTLR